MAHVLRSLGCAAVAACLVGCQLVLGFEELQPESTASAGSNAGAAGAGMTQDPCAGVEAPAGDGEPMVKLARTDGSCFLIDEHEVTNDQYAAFVSAEHDSPSAECAWNEQLVDAECQTSASITAEGDHPVVCVDHCDAKAYCEWGGKELCRGSYAQPTNEAEDDWYSACSNQGRAEIPYGNVSGPDPCNVQATENATTWPVDTGISCVNAEGVRDLIGNVWEWVGPCKTAQDAEDDCLARGGSFIEQNPTCSLLFMPKRGDVSPSRGFRCCAYPN